jgi:hypothetical protein
VPFVNFVVRRLKLRLTTKGTNDTKDCSIGGHGVDGGSVHWTPASVAPSGACFYPGREPTTHAVGYHLSVLRTCRGREECAGKRGMEPASVRPFFAAFAASREATSARQWGRVYKLYICRHTGRQ